MAVDGSLYSGCSVRVPLTVPPASPIREVSWSTLSDGTSLLVTTSRTLRSASAPWTSVGATASANESVVLTWDCSCCVRSSRLRLSFSSALTWFLMSARIGSLRAVVPMTIPSATARKTAISETR